MSKVLFLPGSGASPDFWKPVGAHLPKAWTKEYFGWPGLGDQPHDPAITSFDDLIRLVDAKIDGPVDLVAQSMGGVIAANIALARPDVVRRLVMTVTSGGVDMASFGAVDWRPSFGVMPPPVPSSSTRGSGEVIREEPASWNRYQDHSVRVRDRSLMRQTRQMVRPDWCGHH